MQSWYAVEQTLGSYQEELSEFGGKIDGWFANIERLSDQLDDRNEQVGRQQQSAAEREMELALRQQQTDQFSQTLRQQHAQLTAALNDLTGLKDQLLPAVEEHAAVRDSSNIAPDTLGPDFDLLNDKLNEVLQHLKCESEDESHFEELRIELVSLRGEIERQHQSDAARNDTGLGEMLERILDSCEFVRDETAMVRTRDDELLAELVESKQLVIEHQAVTDKELSELRQSLDSHLQNLGEDKYEASLEGLRVELSRLHEELVLQRESSDEQAAKAQRQTVEQIEQAHQHVRDALESIRAQDSQLLAELAESKLVGSRQQESHESGLSELRTSLESVLIELGKDKTSPQFEALQSEVAGLRAELEHQRESASTDSDDRHRELLERLTGVCELVKSETAAVRSGDKSLLAELAASKQLIARQGNDLGAKLSRVRQALEERLRQLADDDDANHFAELQDELRRLCDEVQRQRESADENANNAEHELINQVRAVAELLKVECEAARSRDDTLMTGLSESKQLVGEHRLELESGLRELQRSIDSGFLRLAAVGGSSNIAASVESVASISAATPGQTDASDPVVNSVMAQFAKLQRDAAQRRNLQSPSGP